MTDPTHFIQLYERGHWVIVRQTDGLTHADSLLQLPFRANCLNWVLGHIIIYRDTVLKLLGETPTLSEGETRLYLRESEPITEAEPAVPLGRLLEALEQSQKRLVDALKNVTPDKLDAYADKENQRTVRQRIEFLQWHETYHVGQLEILRQLAGKDDAII